MCLGAAAPVTGAAADEHNLNGVDCDASVTVPRLVLKWGSGGYPQPPEANVKDNGFPWPPPGLREFFILPYLAMQHADRVGPDDFLVRASEPGSASAVSAGQSSASARKRTEDSAFFLFGSATDALAKSVAGVIAQKASAQSYEDRLRGMSFVRKTDALPLRGSDAERTQEALERWTPVPTQSTQDTREKSSPNTQSVSVPERGDQAQPSMSLLYEDNIASVGDKTPPGKPGGTPPVLFRWQNADGSDTTWLPNTEEHSTASQFASLSPFCPSSTPDLMHQMVVSDGGGGKENRYCEYSCDLCAENKSGRRWQCWRCNIDYCFACRPDVPTAVLPPAEMHTQHSAAKDELTKCSALQAIWLHAGNSTNTKQAAGWTNENTESSVNQPGNLRQPLPAVEYVDRPVVEYVDRPVVKYVEVVKEVPVVEYREVVHEVHLEQMERIALFFHRFVFFLETMHHTESAKWAKQKAQAARDQEQRAADTNDTNELCDKELRQLRRKLTEQETFYREFYREQYEAQRNEVCQLQSKLAERESMQAQSEEDLQKLRNKMAEHESMQAHLEDQVAQHQGAIQRMLEHASLCQEALQLAHAELKSSGQRLETEHVARCDAEQKLKAVTEQAAKDLAKLHAVTERAQEMEMEFDLIHEERSALQQDKANILQMKEQLEIQRIDLQAIKNDLPTQIRGAQKAERERTRELLAQASRASGEQLLRALVRASGGE